MFICHISIFASKHFNTKVRFIGRTFNLMLMNFEWIIHEFQLIYYFKISSKSSWIIAAAIWSQKYDNWRFGTQMLTFYILIVLYQNTIICMICANRHIWCTFHSWFYLLHIWICDINCYWSKHMFLCAAIKISIVHMVCGVNYFHVTNTITSVAMVVIQIIISIGTHRKYHYIAK